MYTSFIQRLQNTQHWQHVEQWQPDCRPLFSYSVACSALLHVFLEGRGHVDCLLLALRVVGIDLSWLRITSRHERVILACASLVVGHPWAVVHADASSLEGSLTGGQPWAESWHSTSGRVEGAGQSKEEGDSEEDELHFVWSERPPC